MYHPALPRVLGTSAGLTTYTLFAGLLVQLVGKDRDSASAARWLPGAGDLMHRGY